MIILQEIKIITDTNIADVAYPKFLEKLSICQDLFYGYDYSLFKIGSELQRAKVISGAVNFIIDPSREEDKDIFIKESLLMHQALSLCSSIVDEDNRFEAAFFETIRVMVNRLMNSGSGQKLSLPEING